MKSLLLLLLMPVLNYAAPEKDPKKLSFEEFLEQLEKKFGNRACPEKPAPKIGLRARL